MDIYRDRVLYSEKAVQISYRDGSIEVNKLRAEVLGYRANVNGCWYIVSVQDGNESNEAMHKLDKFIRYDQNCGGFSEAELFSGSVELGRDVPDVDELVKSISDLCLETKGVEGTRCEVIVNLKDVAKSIERDDGKAVDRRRVVDVEVSLLGRSSYGAPILASTHRAFISWSPREVMKLIEEAVKVVVEKIRKRSSARSLSPLHFGGTSIVLSKQASTSLVHELSHILDAEYVYSARLKDVQIASKEFNLYDDPHDYEAPSMRFFDDEGVTTRKRVLVEEGVVRDLHYTRTTASIFNGEPGSAYGLFSRPFAFHSVLVLKPGDWKENEIIEETKSGYYVEDIVMATLERSYIRIVPEVVYRIENGELKEAQIAHEIKIPHTSFKSIDAISKNLYTNISIEKGYIVTEKAPTIRLRGYIS